MSKKEKARPGAGTPEQAVEMATCDGVAISCNYSNTGAAGRQCKVSNLLGRAPCNIKCERTNTTSNDGCKFYRIYFFISRKAVKCKRNGGETWCGSTDI